jgi:hypothetical protein
MATHLRFEAKTGKVIARTFYGEHTEELLQLNDNTVVQYRLSTLTTVRLFTVEIDQLERQLKALARQLRVGTVSQTEYDVEEQDINQDLADLRYTLQAKTGQLPLPPLNRKRLGVSLI